MTSPRGPNRNEHVLGDGTGTGQIPRAEGGRALKTFGADRLHRGFPRKIWWKTESVNSHHYPTQHMVSRSFSPLNGSERATPSGPLESW